jgi:hypothetical protein
MTDVTWWRTLPDITCNDVIDRGSASERVGGDEDGV